MSRTLPFTVRLLPTVRERLVVEAERLALRPSDVVRLAVERYLGFSKDENESSWRHHQISEFSQVALDRIITQQYPQFREEILTETNRRMEKYHAR
ncbi:hypothetical protein [Sphingomonas sp. VNH70]|uniref:hypothetical protein n=1 Tax=Sphingomonas silueang TaxID=3156617 RepID=UPI0032B49053